MSYAVELSKWHRTHQLCTVHGIVCGKVMALAYATSLPNKTQMTCVEMFHGLPDALVLNFSNYDKSRTFLTDFEAAAINAIIVVSLSGFKCPQWLSISLPVGNVPKCATRRPSTAPRNY